MKIRKTWLVLFVAWVWVSFGAGPVRAQSQQDDTPPPPPPKAAARDYSGVLDTLNEQEASGNQNAGDEIRPDTRPLTGIQTLTIGTRQFRHSFFVPGFQIDSTIQSANLNDAVVGTPNPGWSANNYFLGSLSLLETGSRSQLALNYSGGGFYSTDHSLGSGNIQELGVIQAFQWRRLQLQFLDQFAYLPETQFGFGGATNLSIPGIDTSLSPNLPGLGANIAPSQNIFGGVGSRLVNAFAIQGTYALSGRSSITMAGGYDLLHFLTSVAPGAPDALRANYDTDNVVGNLGYEYALTRADSIGAFYRYTAYHFAGNAQATGDHLVNVAYGRKITGRLALQLTGGPDFVRLRVPVDNKTDLTLWSGSASLVYAVKNGGMTAGYSHGTSGGSGVLVGSTADQFTFGGNHQVGRLWNLLGSFGYARNKSLGSNASQTFQQSFDSWFFTAGLARPLGPNANFTLGYTARIQSSSGIACPVTVCGTNFTQHQVSVGFRWSARPFVIH
jgi:hypothetical protein